jgi:hypothetical protein
MARRIPFALTLGLTWLLAATAFAETVEISTRHGKSWRGTADGLPALVLRGTHRERGEAHGRLAAREIVRNVNHLAGFIDRRVPGGWKGAVGEVERFEFAPRFEEERTPRLAMCCRRTSVN